MKMRAILFSLPGLCLAMGSLALQAQQPALPPIPPGPLIQKRAPDFSHWMVTFKTAPAASGATPSPSQPSDPNSIITQDTVTKTENIIHVEFIDTQKRAWNIWVQGGRDMIQWPDGKSVGFVAKPPPYVVNPLYRDFSSSDFSGFEWISAANFTGIQSIGGISCLVFKDTLLTNGVSLQVEAATDVKTRLPVRLINGQGQFTYAFLSPPSTEQTLPANVQKLIVDQRNNEKSLARRPGPAF